MRFYTVIIIVMILGCRKNDDIKTTFLFFSFVKGPVLHLVNTIKVTQFRKYRKKKQDEMEP